VQLTTEIGGQRDAFAVPDGVAYFNTASLAPMLRRVLDAGHDALARRSRPWAVRTADWFDEVEALRSLIGGLVGGDAEGVALVPATSYGMAVAARNLADRLGPRAGVLVLAEEYPSGVYTWRAAARDTGAAVVTVGREPGQTWTEAVLARLDERIGIASVPNVHWTDGARVDLDAVARRARDVGAALVVDASQSLGAIPLDVTSLRPDVVVSVGYKWLLGPVGRGYLWIAEEHREGRPLEENWIARAGSRDFAALVDYRDEYEPGARRFDQGERTMLELTPMAVAAVDQVRRWGVERIGAALAATTAAVVDRLGPLGLSPTVPAAERSPHMVGIPVPDDARGRVLPALEEQGCHAALRGSSLRVAPHLHVTVADIDRLATALASAL
jgi:selenocysteine lyase/cysteine desulfurase